MIGQWCVQLVSCCSPPHRKRTTWRSTWTTNWRRCNSVWSRSRLNTGWHGLSSLTNMSPLKKPNQLPWLVCQSYVRACPLHFFFSAFCPFFNSRMIHEVNLLIFTPLSRFNLFNFFLTPSSCFCSLICGLMRLTWRGCLGGWNSRSVSQSACWDIALKQFLQYNNHLSRWFLFAFCLLHAGIDSSLSLPRPVIVLFQSPFYLDSSPPLFIYIFKNTLFVCGRSISIFFI